MEGETESLIFLYLYECLNCQLVGGCVRPAENVSVFPAIFKKIASAKSWRVRGAFTQPAFMGSCLTITHMCFPCPPSRQVSPGVPGVIEGSGDADAAWV